MILDLRFKNNKIKIYSILVVILVIVSILITINITYAQSIATRLKGKILLQVEQNGEAWYVNPANEKRYYMGRPADAFNLMRELGVGITNANLEKIPIDLSNLIGLDTDQDGLPDLFEDAISTEKSKADTDGDGYDDKTELENGYHPYKTGKLNIDNNFADSQKGKIFLQIEAHGEAWYVNPDDGKRYFLGRPADAFNIMRSLGLGIKDSDLEKIVQFTSLEQVPISHNIELAINFSKNSYELGELVEGEYDMSYSGEPFKGIVVYSFSREGCSEYKHAKSRGIISTGSFDDGTLSIYKTALKAFKYDKTGSFCSYVAGTDYFYEEGIYTYGLSVYDCSDVEIGLNKNDCGGELRDITYEDFFNIQPVKSVSKSVVVEGGVNPSECETSDDCTKLCDGCEDGTQMCEQSDEVCIDCFMDSQCKSGYKCEENTCISE